MRKILYFLSVFFMLASCSNEDNEPVVPEVPELEVKNDVKPVRIIVDLTEPKGNSQYTYEYEYEEDLLKKITTTGNIPMKKQGAGVTVFEYNADKRLSKYSIMFTFPSNQFMPEPYFEYDNNKIIEIIEYSDGFDLVRLKLTYYLDSNGRVIRTYSRDEEHYGDINVYYIYDANGNLIKLKGVASYDSGYYSESEELYEYDLDYVSPFKNIKMQILQHQGGLLSYHAKVPFEYFGLGVNFCVTNHTAVLGTNGYQLAISKYEIVSFKEFSGEKYPSEVVIKDDTGSVVKKVTIEYNK